GITHLGVRSEERIDGLPVQVDGATVQPRQVEPSIPAHIACADDAAGQVRLEPLVLQRAAILELRVRKPERWRSGDAGERSRGAVAVGRDFGPKAAIDRVDVEATLILRGALGPEVRIAELRRNEAGVERFGRHDGVGLELIEWSRRPTGFPQRGPELDALGEIV